GGEQTVVANSGRGGDAVRNLLLHHDDNGFKIGMILKQVEQDVGGDEVGQVADQAGLFGHVDDARMVHSGTRAEHGAEVNGDYVALNNLDIFESVEMHAQLRRQHAVKFDSDDTAGPFGQFVGQRAAPGTDFYHRLFGDIPQSIDDAFGSVWISQKVLSQFGTPAVSTRNAADSRLQSWRLRFPQLGGVLHVDPLSFCHLDSNFTQ